MAAVFDRAAVVRAFTAPAGLDRSTPREVVLTGRGRVLLVIGATLMISAPVVGALLLREATVRPASTSVWLAPLVGGVSLFIGALCRVVLLTERRLLSEGRAAPAVVTKVTKPHGNSHGMIAYDVLLPGGGVRSAMSASGSKPPAVGSVICIVYDPERPRRTLRYPPSLVRLAFPPPVR